MTLATLAISSASGVASACMRNSSAPASIILVYLPFGSLNKRFLEPERSRVTSQVLTPKFSIAKEKAYEPLYKFAKKLLTYS